MRYRRANIGGATCFFTVNLADRKSTLLVEQIDLLREQCEKSGNLTLSGLLRVWYCQIICMLFGAYLLEMLISHCTGL